MATKVLRDHYVQTTSAIASQVNGQEIRCGGNPVVAELSGPDPLGGLEGSMDKLTWKTLVDDLGIPVSALDTAIVNVTRTPKWVRHIVAADVGGPQDFDANIGVVKESS